MFSTLLHRSHRLLCGSLGLSLLLASYASADTRTSPTSVTHYAYTVVSERAHDPALFTQGLLIDGGFFYESSGLYGRSLLVRYPVKPSFAERSRNTPQWSQVKKIPNRHFAEGLTLLDDYLYLLTWQEQTLLVYNKTTFKLEKQFSYQGQGWGLTYDGSSLIRSDGSSTLFFHKPDDFSVVKTLKVTENGFPLALLNELEYIDGKIWANIWYEDRIVEINPTSGHVEGSVDLSALAKINKSNSEHVLNGIAWDEATKTIWITGKMWPNLYQITINSGAAKH